MPVVSPSDAFGTDVAKDGRDTMSRAEVLARLSAERDTLNRRFGVVTLSVFGSAARDMLSASSDVDLLVDFQTPPDFDRYFDLKFYLEDVLGRPVDLVTRQALRPELRPRVESEAVHVA